MDEDETEVPETPEQPEPLANLRRLRRFNFVHLVYGGGQYNQPHIYMRELHQCIDAEIEHERRVSANIALKKALQDENIRPT
jgi:hypothetical protein